MREVKGEGPIGHQERSIACSFVNVVILREILLQSVGARNEAFVLEVAKHVVERAVFHYDEDDGRNLFSERRHGYFLQLSVASTLSSLGRRLGVFCSPTLSGDRSSHGPATDVPAKAS